MMGTIAVVTEDALEQDMSVIELTIVVMDLMN